MTETRKVQLRHLSVISATGEECNAFLQGQLSNDLRALTVTRAQLSTLNSAKGRVVAVMQLARFESGILIVVPAAIDESVVETMSKYILRSKVTLAITPGMAMFGLIGPKANDALEEIGGGPLDNDWSCLTLERMIAWRTPGITPRIIVAGAAPAVAKAYASLAKTPAGDIHSWRREEIFAGLPEILPPTQDKFVAQMLRLDALGAIDFDKGCYTGQEIIARAHYLGNVKRVTAIGRTAAKRPLKPGETLKLDGKPAALVVSGAPLEEGGQVVMLVLHGVHKSGTVITAQDGVEVTIEREDTGPIQAITLRFR